MIFCIDIFQSRVQCFNLIKFFKTFCPGHDGVKDVSIKLINRVSNESDLVDRERGTVGMQTKVY